MENTTEKTNQDLLQEYCEQFKMDIDGNFKAVDVRIMMDRAVINHIDKRLAELTNKK